MEQSNGLLTRMSVLVRFIVVALVIVILGVVAVRIFQGRQAGRVADQTSSGQAGKKQEADSQKDKNKSANDQPKSNESENLVEHQASPEALPAATDEIPNTGVDSGIVFAALLSSLVFLTVHILQARRQSR